MEARGAVEVNFGIYAGNLSEWRERSSVEDAPKIKTRHLFFIIKCIIKK